MKEVNKLKHNYKIEQQDVVDIITSHMLDNSMSNVQRLMDKYNISKQRVYQIISSEKNNKLVDECINRNRKNFTKKCDTIINNLLDRINSEAVDKSKDIDINKLSTSLGILYDKSRLESGLSTENKAISVNIKIDT